MIPAALSDRDDVVDLVGARLAADVTDAGVLPHDEPSAPLLAATAGRPLPASASLPGFRRMVRTGDEVGATPGRADLGRCCDQPTGTRSRASAIGDALEGRKPQPRSTRA